MKRTERIARRTFLRLAVAGSSSLALSSQTQASSSKPSDEPLQTQNSPQVNENNSKDSSVSLGLISPPAARTDSTIAVLWKKTTGRGLRSYQVFLNGRFVATTQNTDFTFDRLGSGEEYEITLRCEGESSSDVQSETLRVTTKRRPRVLEVTHYGAVGDGTTLNTASIQATITSCRPGDVVRIPRGTFLSGALYLKSDMTLLVDEGAVLLGSTSPKDYPLMRYRWEGRERVCYASLLNTEDSKGSRWRDITILGSGTINANGVALRKAQLREAKGAPGRAVCIRDTDRVYLYGVTVRQSPSWCVHLIFCSDVGVNGVSIQTKYDESGAKYEGIVNGDGLDPDSCRDVFVFDSHIASEDDCIAIKSGRDEEGRAVGIPTENVRITRCRFTSGFGVAIGSEMAGGVRNVSVEDCVFEDTFSIASIKAPRGRGNVVENVTYRDCTLTNTNAELHDSKWYRGALYVDQLYGVDAPDPLVAKPKDEGTAVIRNVLFQNITLTTVGGNAIYLSGLPENPLENVRFENVIATGKQGFIAYNARGLELDQIRVQAREGEAMRFVNVR